MFKVRLKKNTQPLSCPAKWFYDTINFMHRKKEWFNDDDFWKLYSPVIFDNKRWAEVPKVVAGLRRFAGFESEGAVKHKPKALDLCCGMGRITLELARSGFAATGVDITASFLETAREDAAYEKLDIEYINADARSFIRPGFYDIAVNLYISFGYFEDPAEDLLVARNVFESLKPGGSFIIETLGKEIAVRDFMSGESFERAGFTVITEYEIVDSWGALKNRWILIPNSFTDSDSEETTERIEKTFTQRLYAATELRSLLFQAGFSAVEIYGGWDERPYDEDALMLIAVGRKG
jgi:2-polyprenyl-3-methyl-5-hydroxy-6-metoxy-1,4-benzoquinol methylase